MEKFTVGCDIAWMRTSTSKSEVMSLCHKMLDYSLWVKGEMQHLVKGLSLSGSCSLDMIGKQSIGRTGGLMQDKYASICGEE